MWKKKATIVLANILKVISSQIARVNSRFSADRTFRIFDTEFYTCRCLTNFHFNRFTSLSSKLKLLQFGNANGNGLYVSRRNCRLKMAKLRVWKNVMSLRLSRKYCSFFLKEKKNEEQTL